MTPNSHEILYSAPGYMESKIVQSRVVEPSSLEVKELHSNKQVKPRSQKQLQGPRSLDRAYIKKEKARIAAATVLVAEKAVNREARKLAKEQKAKEAKERAEALKKQVEVLKLLKGEVTQKQLDQELQEAQNTMPRGLIAEVRNSYEFFESM